jgi:glycosyltransferase involved in cell wall biosynthesis
VTFQKQRVLFFAFHLGPGGLVSHMHTLAKGLVERGWEVALTTRGKFGSHDHGPEWFEAIGVRHFAVPFPMACLRLSSVWDFVQTTRALRKIVRAFEPNLVHVHWRLTSPFAELVHRQFAIPFVSTLHLSSTSASRVHRLVSFWGKHAIGVSSETSKELIQRFGVPEDCVSTVYYGLDEKHFRPATRAERQNARNELGLPSDVYVIAIIGSDYRRKGHAILFAALKQLLDLGVNAIVAVAGDTNERDAIAILATERGVSNAVTLLGYRDVRTVLWAADVLALPSRKEGLPVVVIEAMLCGVVPIRTPTAGCTDQTRDGEDGFVVPFGSPTALAQKIVLLLKNNELRATLSKNAVTNATAKFGMQRMVCQTIKIYEHVLRGNL